MCSPLKLQQCCILDKAHPCTTMCESLSSRRLEFGTTAGKMEFKMLGYLTRVVSAPSTTSPASLPRLYYA